MLLDQQVLAHAFLERLRIHPRQPQPFAVTLRSDELAILLEFRNRGNRAGELFVGDRELQTVRRFEPQFPLDHPVQDLPRKVERPRELRRKTAFVELAVSLDLVLVNAVELDRRDLIAAHFGDDLARGAPSRVRAGKEDESEDEDDDHGEQRPLQLVETGAHGFEHSRLLFGTGDYNRAPGECAINRQGKSRQSRKLCGDGSS